MFTSRIRVPLRDGGNPSPSGEARLVSRGRLRYSRVGAPTTGDLNVHRVGVPKYRQAVLTGDVALRGRDLLSEADRDGTRTGNGVRESSRRPRSPVSFVLSEARWEPD